MKTGLLGQTGIPASELGFGGAPIGLSHYLKGGDRTSSDLRATARAALRTAVSGGITYFDTAPGYGDGLSETLMGEVLPEFRDRVAIATKIRFDPDASLDTLVARFDASLERLGTDRVEVLQIHGSQFYETDAEAILGSAFPALFSQLKDEGRIRGSGITAETPSGALERLVDSGTFDVLQIAYSAIYQGACDYQRAPFGIIPFARERGLGIVAMRTATSGVLQKFMAAAFPTVTAQDVTEAAIAFVLSTPEIDVALVGMRTPDEVTTNLRISEHSPRFDLKSFHAFYEQD